MEMRDAVETIFYRCNNKRMQLTLQFRVYTESNKYLDRSQSILITNMSKITSEYVQSLHMPEQILQSTETTKMSQITSECMYHINGY